MEEFTVYSPWAKSDYLEKRGITKRLSSLEGKTIGMYSSFKEFHQYYCQNSNIYHRLKKEREHADIPL